MEKMALLAPVIGISMMLLGLLTLLYFINIVDPTVLQLAS